MDEMNALLASERDSLTCRNQQPRREPKRLVAGKEEQRRGQRRHPAAGDGDVLDVLDGVGEGPRVDLGDHRRRRLGGGGGDEGVLPCTLLGLAVVPVRVAVVCAVLAPRGGTSTGVG